MKTVYRSFCIGAAALLASCGPNMIPIWSIDLTDTQTNDVVPAFENAARASGFVMKPLPKRVVANFAGGKVAQLIEVWDWPEHPSTAVTLYHVVGGGSEIFFSDSQTDGFELVGPPCRKYLDFIAALKSTIPPDHLKFWKTTCDASKNPS